MSAPNERLRKQKNIRKPGGKSTLTRGKKKTSKHTCAICTTKLNGMPNGLRSFQVKRLSKTQRRPENALASLLCPKCREKVYLDAVMVKYNLKKEDDCDYRYRKYLSQIIHKVE